MDGEASEGYLLFRQLFTDALELSGEDEDWMEERMFGRASVYNLFLDCVKLK